jgi:ParB-like chromosome segregation protein Spo0J
MARDHLHPDRHLPAAGHRRTAAAKAVAQSLD